MPMNRDRYPLNWDKTALLVKRAADWTCEACGRPCRQPGEDWLNFLLRQPWTVGEAIAAARHPRQYTLTTAHINHDPENPDAELRAWCAPCHLRYDAQERKCRRAAARMGFAVIIEDSTHG
jgi:hypothetical protein